MTETERARVPDPPADPAARAWRNLRLAILERGDRRREVTEALGMSFFRVKALCRIAAAPVPMTLRDLAHDLVTDRPYATLVVDDLVGRGLAERTVNPGDRRSKLVTVTAAGRAAAAEAERVLDTPPPALYDLPPEDVAALDRIAARLAADL
ncbi:MarR family winged helix-turn-helix transcriptional regulator [Actinomadura algeriensis]|uniref:DNA-binding MarR family transcriptional regulator n=1 Tax=Actinomadura algeriensis TaxID=1679523 RepID=A0ABR9JWU3_9ACTN|nr:MarR family transcriptional regulator [Actinomadura algeriensis]MBE1535055.1 DNA-binding MarR family transcriptional regulator [Actinomadura algeriensis]